MHTYTDSCIFDILVVSSTNDIFVFIRQRAVLLQNMPVTCDITMKKSARRDATLLAGCSKTEPKNFAPPQTPFTGAQDG